MFDIIKNILQKASDEQDLDLAIIANELISELQETANIPKDWKIAAKLYLEFKNNQWLLDIVTEIAMYEDII